MALEGGSSDLLHVVMLLGAAVVAVPLFKRLGLGSVLKFLEPMAGAVPNGSRRLPAPARCWHPILLLRSTSR